MPRRRLRNFSIFVGLLLATGVFALATVLESGVLTPRLIHWVNARLEPALGLRLLATAVYWLFHDQQVPQIGLNVHGDNSNARSLYESAGFRLAYTGVGLRRGVADSDADESNSVPG
jgi:hypothetical protein